MTIVVVGLNHKTAPIELREQFLSCDTTLPAAPNGLGGLSLDTLHQESLLEFVVLSTCNRLEVYASVAGSAESGWATIQSYLAELQAVPIEALRSYLYCKEGQAVVEHLMNVACGLDSLILGEPQILGQVAQAFSSAQAAGTAGPILSHLFAQAIHTGKRAHTETEISHYTTSVSHAAVLLAQAKIGDLSRAHVLIVGAGEMAGLAAQALKSHRALDVRCINRTYAHAEAVAARVGGLAMHWYDLSEALAWADVVISATRAPHTVIYAADVERVLPRRDQRPLVFVDVAVPRDVEEAARYLPGVQCCDIDDMKAALDANLVQRHAALPEVQAIIRAEVNHFVEWLNALQVVPVIADLRRKANALAEQEAEWALRHMQGLDAHNQEVITRMAQRLVNKLLHEPVIRLKAEAANGNGYEYAYAIRELFELHDELPTGKDT